MIIGYMDQSGNFDIEKIIQVLDRELIRSGKEYLKISKANEILINNKIFDQIDCRSKVLKNLLENGKFPHGYLANTLPPEWRIPLSTIAKGKSLLTNSKSDNDSVATATKSNKKYVSCPHCYKSSIYVRVDDRKKRNLTCPKCRKVFTNPLLDEESGNNKVISKKALWIIGVIILILLYLISNHSRKDIDSDAERLAKYENATHIGWDYSTWLETTDENIWGNDLIALPGTNNNIYIGYWVKPNITMYLDKRTDKITRFVAGKDR